MKNNKLKINKRIIVCVSIIFVLMISLFASNFINTQINCFLNENLNVVSINDKMLVHFISVDESDAIAVNFPNGKVAIIDTGNPYNSSKVVKYIKENVISKNHNQTIDYVFYTHCDIDHIGGLCAILYAFDVKNVFRSRQYLTSEDIDDEVGQKVDSDALRIVVDTIKNETGCNFSVPQNNMLIEEGGATLKVFYPEKKYDSSNDYSYYIKLTFKGKSILLTGDAGVEVEKNMINEFNEELKSDILKIAHHGSNSSTSTELLDVVKPDYAVISVGENSYGHPSDSILQRLNNVGIKHLYRTDVDDNILVSFDDNIKFFTDNYSFTILHNYWGMFVLIICLILICLLIFDFVKILKNKKMKT